MKSMLAALVAVAGLMVAQYGTSSPVGPVGDREAQSVVGGVAGTGCPTWMSTTFYCGYAYCSAQMATVNCPNFTCFAPGPGTGGSPNGTTSSWSCIVCGSTCGIFYNVVTSLGPCVSTVPVQPN
jgi:hypothetical protein